MTQKKIEKKIKKVPEKKNDKPKQEKEVEKKKKEDKKIFVNITAKVKLTEQESNEMGKKAAELNKEICEMIIKLDQIKVAKKKEIELAEDEISTKDSDMRKNLRCINKGEQEKVVQAERKFNLDTQECEFWFDNQIVLQRPMTDKEKQHDLDIFGDELPKENETSEKKEDVKENKEAEEKPTTLCPEWLRRNEMVLWTRENEEAMSCTVSDIKIENETVLVKIMGYSEYYPVTQFNKL
jgi:colicin import membrane protein